jgi:hypothetical protein
MCNAEKSFPTAEDVAAAFGFPAFAAAGFRSIMGDDTLTDLDPSDYGQVQDAIQEIARIIKLVGVEDDAKRQTIFQYILGSQFEVTVEDGDVHVSAEIEVDDDEPTAQEVEDTFDDDNGDSGPVPQEEAQKQLDELNKLKAHDPFNGLSLSDFLDTLPKPGPLLGAFVDPRLTEKQKEQFGLKGIRGDVGPSGPIGVTGLPGSNQPSLFPELQPLRTITIQVGVPENYSDQTYQITKVAAAQLQKYLELFLKKQESYGMGNIGSFGELGVLVRLNDKIERLKNLVYRKTSNDLEAVEDTWDDALGYALIGKLVHLGLWK